MKPRRFHGLKRPKIRQTWNKYNLFNIFRMRDPKIGSKSHETFFQQKWRAKGMLRGYHGEHVVERKWERMFSRRLLGVVDMDPAYMARNDGSELAAGRGSGKDEKPNWNVGKVERRVHTPYMQMTFAPMERRLDIAVFRAMFASSARQARQMCVHGKVKVNGKVMPYPAYRLNPGDMFQVEPDMVMLATGQQKRPELEQKKKKKTGKPWKPRKAAAAGEVEEEEEVETEAEAEAAEEETQPPAPAKNQDPDTTDAAEPEKEDLKATRDRLQGLVKQAREIVTERDVSAKQKQKLRNFVKETQKLLSRAGRPNETGSHIARELARVVRQLAISPNTSPLEPLPTYNVQEHYLKTAYLPHKDKPEEEAEERRSLTSIDELSNEERRALERLIQEEMDNPVDPSKPYKTPWKPREFMSPFAFIPRYLEVNQNICSAVYLRHPVARVGSAEVPTPYPFSINQLAFNWYLRRR